MFIVPWSLLPLSACFQPLANGKSGELGGADSSSPPVEASIDGVTPPLGTSAGGQQVVISGQDLAGTELVRFGGEQAALLSVGDGQVTVETPAHPELGLVDVEVEGRGMWGSAPGAFRYVADRTGRQSMLGLQVWTDPVQSLGGGQEPGWALAVLPSGDEQVRLTDFLGPQDDCGSGPLRDSFPASRDLGLGQITLDGHGVSVELEPVEFDSGQPAFLADLTTGGEFQGSGSFDAVLPEGDWPGFTLAGALVPAPSPVLLEPSLYGGTFGQAQQISWEPQGADFAYIGVDLYVLSWTSTSYELTESLSCLVPDDGNYTIPASEWSDWPSWYDLAYVVLTFGELLSTDAGGFPDGGSVEWLSVSITGGTVAVD